MVTLPKFTRVDIRGVDVTSYLLAWAAEQKIDERGGRDYRVGDHNPEGGFFSY